MILYSKFFEGGVNIPNIVEQEILLKEYDFEDYMSITSFFKLMGSDYLDYIKVWNNTSSEEKPNNDKRMYMLFKNECFSKFLVDKIQEGHVSKIFLPNNSTNSSMPYLLYFCVYFEQFNCPTDDFYVAYLFNKDLSKVFLTLILGASNKLNFNLDFYSDNDNLKQTKNKFKEYIDSYKSVISSELNLNLEDYEDDISLGRFASNEVSDVHKQNDKAINYENGSIYVKSYEIDNLPSEEELTTDFNNFIRLYDFVLNKLFDESDVMDDKIDFDEALEIVKYVLRENGTVIDDDYDMLLVKQLPPADIINANKDVNGNTAHIALTSEKMDIFPYLESFDYFYNEKGHYDTNSKVRFLLEVPVNLYSSNLNYLDKNNEFSFEGEKIETTATVVRNRKNVQNWTVEKFKRHIDEIDNDYKLRLRLLGYEVQAELSSTRSGEEFINFRKLLYEGYFLIILKNKNEFKYDIFAILPEDGEDLQKIDYELFTVKNKTVALISSDFWSIDSKDDEKFSHKLWSEEFNESNVMDGGENVLVYGVPGSGKSSYIKNELCNDVDDEHIERVVFHQDYTYSDFIGQILPIVSDDKKVSYEFKEGPFTSILMKACANANQRYFLIIEEINRGNAPAIFGDIFQLLDRKIKPSDDFPTGTSEYAITNSEISGKVYKDEKHKIRIPPNLSIIATMNTADQNVFTLDTAFQRRWDMKLIPNKFEKDHEFAEDDILDTTITWKEFVNHINKLILKENTLTTSSEDKRLGVYFVQKGDLDDENKFAEKVLKYLWDDAFKFSRGRVFNKDCKSLEEVIEKFIKLDGNSRFEVFIDNEFKDDLSSDGGNIDEEQ